MKSGGMIVVTNEVIRTFSYTVIFVPHVLRIIWELNWYHTLLLYLIGVVVQYN